MNEGKLIHFGKGEEFVSVDHVARYIGYILSGTMKYVAYSADGKEYVVGLQADGDFIADFPWSLYGQDARVSIVAVNPSDVYCYPTKDLKLRCDSNIDLQKDGSMCLRCYTLNALRPLS